LKYALLGYGASTAMDSLSDVERAAWEADDAAFNAELTDRRCIVHGEPLADADTATTVRVHNGQVTMTDGPFVESIEHLGGILVVDVPDLDSALDLARRCPAARIGAIEVRPIRSM
jgi:hypothetical protein